MKVARYAAVLILLAGCGGEEHGPPPGFPLATSTPTEVPSGTPTVTATPTPTPTLGPGANIGFIGILRADDTLIDAAGEDGQGRPVFKRDIGSGFVIVLDVKPGTNGTAVGPLTYNYDPEDPTVRPDLQIQASRDLGDGSPDVCDNENTEEEEFGGVPGFDPSSFEETQEISDALNDFGCRFIDGSGDTVGRSPSNEACVLFPDGEFHFVDPSARVEFCATIARGMSFPSGDTVVTARVRDEDGVFGPQRQIVIHVGP